MNSSNQFQMVGKEGILTKSILTQKMFELNNIKWSYENNFRLSLLSQEATSKLKIKNHLCQMNGNAIKKITQITYKDKVYTIEDTYLLNVPQNEINHHTQQLPRQAKDAVSTNDSDKNDTKDKTDGKKVYIFKKMRRRRLTDEKDNERSRNTKNVTKNFCKAFVSYLKSEKVNNFQRKRIRQAIKAYNQLLQGKKYNNNLIKKIISNEVLRDLFKHFLQVQAKNWISQSRVNDKILHHDAISIYLNQFNKHPLEKGFSESSSSYEQESPISENQEE